MGNSINKTPIRKSFLLILSLKNIDQDTSELINDID